jgi:FkbM family methyltransferase
VEADQLTVGRRGLSKVFGRIGDGAYRISRKLYLSSRATQVALWFADRGDKTFRLNYDLHENSQVFDLGGYEGQWTSDIYSMYCCTVHVFEPVVEFAQKLEQRFAKNRKILVHRFGLSSQGGTRVIAVNRNSSSLYSSEGEFTEARLVRAADFFRQHRIEWIDLMKINTEGGEYDLLEHIIESGLIRNIGNIQVQFHDVVPDAERRMRRIQAALSVTHDLTYQYPLVWENWRLRGL